MWDTIKKTIIFTIIVVIIIAISFEVYTVKSLGSEVLYKTDLDKNDELVAKLMSRIVINEELRIPYLRNDKLDNDTKIKYIFLSLAPEDFTYRTVSPTKVLCEIDGLTFNSSHTCDIKIIKNEVFNNYNTYYFNQTDLLDLKDFEYQGWVCKNHWNQYYCKYEAYELPYKTYSRVDSAYVFDNKIVIYEYFLQIPNEEAASVEVDDEFIKSRGVLYKHTFIRNEIIKENQTEELNYYLEESLIVTD